MKIINFLASIIIRIVLAIIASVLGFIVGGAAYILAGLVIASVLLYTIYTILFK